MRYIEVLHNNTCVKSVSFEDRTFLIGSSSACDICLPGLAPRQFKIIKDSQRILVYNLLKPGSLQVNGRDVSSTVLVLDDALRSGNYDFRFVSSEITVTESDISELKSKIHNALIERIDRNKVKVEVLSAAELWDRCGEIIDAIIKNSQIPLGVDLDKLKKDVLNEALALGPLEALLKDDSVTEIMVNSKDKIFIEQEGRLKRTDMSFTSDKHVINIISRIVAAVGRRVDESNPMVDARLHDGSRVNAIIPPLALRGPALTIRKFAKKMFSEDDLIKFGSVRREALDFINVCVEIRRNIVISGGTGTGKTCFLNVVSSYISPAERLVTIEDSAELRLPHEDLVALEARPANIEGKGAVTIRDLVRNSLRMRPDRIIVGECRGGEAVDMLQAMNTGHDGSLTTIHANSAYDAILRMETMAMMSGLDLPAVVIRRQIASAVNIIIQLARFSDGSRKIVGVSEVNGMGQGDNIIINEIFTFRLSSIGPDNRVSGEFVATGYVPSFIKDLASRGVKLPSDIFNKDRVLK